MVVPTVEVVVALLSEMSAPFVNIPMATVQRVKVPVR